VEQAHGLVVQARADAFPQVRAGLTYQRTFASPFTSSGNFPSIEPFAPDSTAPLDQRIKYLEDQYPLMLPRGLGDLFRATPFGRVNTWTGNVTISQLLFQGGKVGAGLSGARAYEEASRAQLEETRNDIVYRTRRAYLTALYSERLVQIAEGGRQLAEDQLRRVETNQRVGSTSDYELLRAQVEVSNQDPLVIAARNDRDIALLQLRALVNVAPEVPLQLDPGPLAAGDSIVDVDVDAISAAEVRRASIQAAEATVEFRRQAVRVFQGDMWPALRLNVYLGTQAYPNGFMPSASSFRRDWNASLSLSWGIFEGLRTRAQVDQARAQLSQAQLQLAQAREAAVLEVAQARAELERARALLVARRQTVAQAQRAQHLASVRYANGIATPLEVSDARLALQQAQVNEAQALRDYLLGIAGVERALGHPVPVRVIERRASEDSVPADSRGGSR
jgi:outer membrane protein TolC